MAGQEADKPPAEQGSAKSAEESAQEAEELERERQGEMYLWLDEQLRQQEQGRVDTLPSWVNQPLDNPPIGETPMEPEDD